VGPI